VILRVSVISRGSGVGAGAGFGGLRAVRPPERAAANAAENEDGREADDARPR